MSDALLPSQVQGRPSLFDRFATKAEAFVSKAWFFALCVLLVLLWAPSILLFQNLDTWQLVINTATTIITFLLVALLQNTQRRANDAVQHKLNAVALGQAALLDENADRAAIQRARDELLTAVGLENNEHS